MNKFIIILSILIIFQSDLAMATDQLNEKATALFSPLIKSSSISVIIGVISSDNQTVTIVGNQTVNQDSIFEIGSITKLFTALEIILLSENRKLNLNDSISKFFPQVIVNHSPALNQIKIIDLLTHTSGLSRLPPNLTFWSTLFSWQFNNPYQSYDTKKLYEGLADIQLASKPGTKYEYSNFGYGILGQIITNTEFANYETVIKTKILKPLNLMDTGVILSEDQQMRLTSGHSKNGNTVSNWDTNALVGAGGLKSSTRDLMHFLEIIINGSNIPSIDRALASMNIEQYHAYEKLPIFIGYGWHISKRNHHSLVWHDGATGGYSAFIGFNKEKKIGVVVLANASMPNELTKAGFEYLVQLCQ